MSREILSMLEIFTKREFPYSNLNCIGHVIVRISSTRKKEWSRWPQSYLVRDVHVDLLTTGALSESFLKRIHSEEVLLYAEEDSITVSMFPEWIVDLKRALKSI